MGRFIVQGGVMGLDYAALIMAEYDRELFAACLRPWWRQLVDYV
jgi:hypothetical protein